MTTETRYYLEQGWVIEDPGAEDLSTGGAPFARNTLGGRILMDTPVKNVLRAIKPGGSTFEELQKKKLISRDLLQTLLTVYTRAGVLTAKPAAASPSPSLPSLPSSPPLVSAVIVNYRGDPHLPELIPSLKNQSYENLEIVVIDNASSDNSCEWLRTHHPDVKLTALNRNIGFAAAVNLGIEKSSGEYVLVLNNDILVDEHAVAFLVEKAFSLEGDWSAIAPKMMFYNNRAFINAIGNSIYPISWGSDNFIGAVDFGQFDGVEESFSACFGAVLLNREVVDRIGGLDPRYGFYYEDMDWSFRAQVHGYPIFTEPRAVIYHKFGASMSLQSQAFKLRYVVGNRLRFCLKNLDKKALKRYLPNYLWEDLRSALGSLKWRNFSVFWAYVRGYMRLTLALPRVLMQRRKLKRSRLIHDHSRVFSKAVPLNLTYMEYGFPKLDTFSLRINYFEERGEGRGERGEEKQKGDRQEIGMDEILVWRLRPPRKDRRAPEKIYMEFSFEIEETGEYDIILLGLMRGFPTLYLDHHLVEPLKKGAQPADNIFEMTLPAVEGIHLEAGRHTLDLGRRSNVHAVIIKTHR